MSNFNMGGIGKINGGQYDNMNIEGVSSCSSDIKAQNIHIEGVFTCSGEVQAETLYCEGVCDFKANIRTNTLTVEGVLNEKEGTKIEAQRIDCDGVIRTNGEIYADVLNANGCVTAKEIYGDQIKINTHVSFSRFKKFINSVKSEIKLIEATTVELSGVMVDTINAQDIKIGPNCRVDSIDCNGTLSIDSSSTVKSITGNYTKL